MAAPALSNYNYRHVMQHRITHQNRKSKINHRYSSNFTPHVTL